VKYAKILIYILGYVVIIVYLKNYQKMLRKNRFGGMMMTNSERVDKCLELLPKRSTWGNRDRLFRKTIEELGEFAEAIEYDNGSTAKVKKFKGKVTPQEKLHEEICDVAMMVLALAFNSGLKTDDVLRTIYEKLEDKEKTWGSKDG
jgi:NTP pyrophosphatase (non-canonical NTP hydrolase)